MRLSPADRLQEYLSKHNITPEKFSRISGMPLSEVVGIMEGRLPITTLRAHHLAAVFDTKAEIWLAEGVKALR